MADPADNNVAAQRAERSSALTLTRDLLALRRRTPALHAGAYRSLPAPPGAWCFGRPAPGAGPDAVVALNLSGDPVEVEVPPGTVAVATERRRDGEAAAGALGLGPFEGALIVVDAP